MSNFKPDGTAGKIDPVAALACLAIVVVLAVGFYNIFQWAG